MSTAILDQISHALRSETQLDGLVRRFLTLIEIVTGLESSYLTRIDGLADRQTVLFSRNTGSLVIAEGLSVPWGDTLCKRALDEGCPFTNDVATRWGDSAAARALGIQTYLSTPVYVDHELYGTLCGASPASRVVHAESQQLLTLFGEIIALFIEKGRLVEQLDEANRKLEVSALTDPLTGLPNRRFMMMEIARLFAIARRSRQDVLIAFIDLDGFKEINDTHGHDAGDALLVALARRLAPVLRQGDVAGRIGGDEFLVCGLSPEDPDHDRQSCADTFAHRLGAALTGAVDLVDLTIVYKGPSIGAVRVAPETLSPEEAIHQADAAMYAEKVRRKAGRLAPPQPAADL